MGIISLQMCQRLENVTVSYHDPGFVIQYIHPIKRVVTK